MSTSSAALVNVTLVATKSTGNEIALEGIDDLLFRLFEGKRENSF